MSKFNSDQVAMQVIHEVAGEDWWSVYEETLSVALHAGGTVEIEVLDRDEYGKVRGTPLERKTKILTFETQA